MPRLPHLLALAVVAVAGYLALPAIGSHRATPVLDAVVGENDAYTIGLFFPGGTRVATLKPGTYTVVVHDKSAIHDFHLASNDDPTVNFRTDVPFVGDQSFTVTFRPSTRYAYACEPHWQVMNGSFRTLAVATAPPPTGRRSSRRPAGQRSARRACGPGGCGSSFATVRRSSASTATRRSR